MNVSPRVHSGDVRTIALAALIVGCASVTVFGARSRCGSREGHRDPEHGRDEGGRRNGVEAFDRRDSRSRRRTAFAPAPPAGRPFATPTKRFTGSTRRARSRSSLRLRAEAASSKILSGQSYFTTRTPKDFGRVQTPTVTAAIKGTEFAVSVADNGGTTITMIEGTVEASNEFGSVTVTRGEEAVTEPGKAPQRRIVVRPRDAVMWSFYYPQVLGGSDRGDERLGRAASALSSGQVDEARRLLDEAQAADPNNAAGLAMSSIVASSRRPPRRSTQPGRSGGCGERLVSPRRSWPDRTSRRPTSISIARASSRRRAASADPDNAEALGPGPPSCGSPRATTTARAKRRKPRSNRQPNNARALTVLGFVQLANYRTDSGRRLLRPRGPARRRAFPRPRGARHRPDPSRTRRGRARRAADRGHARSGRIALPLVSRQGLLRREARDGGRQGAVRGQRISIRRTRRRGCTPRSCSRTRTGRSRRSTT